MKEKKKKDEKKQGKKKKRKKGRGNGEFLLLENRKQIWHNVKYCNHWKPI